MATRLTSKPWVYVVAVPPSSYTNVLGGSERDLLAGLLLATVLAAAGAFVIYRWLFDPIRRIARYAEEVASGTVNPHQASFAPLAQDEVSREVAGAFDHFLARLRQLLTYGARQG